MKRFFSKEKSWKVRKMPKVYKSADELIGRTPLLELRNIEKEFNLNAKIIAKLEYLNPAGSAKDRVGLAMINDAEEKGIPLFLCN